MSAKPILILQMQRMGDLILSFPLFLWLQREYPGHPLWVVGEPRFYEALLALSPPATYFPWTASAQVRGASFAMCINLSHERTAAALAGEVRAERRLGPVLSADGVLRIYGRWQLYRAGLVHANRHNRFHWADLNALDCIPLSRIATTCWPTPRACLGDRRRIGLFLGASQTAKRPDPQFWANLVREMLNRDLHPILLGGPAERETARTVQQKSGQKVLNLADSLSLTQFADLGQSLELLVTPDTGPMHLAAWTGLRVLNLSLGPVNPWETGPYQPGHFVLQPRISCAGCWSCRHGSHRCHDAFLPRRAAQLIDALAGSQNRLTSKLRSAGGILFRTSSSPEGLYHLEPLLPDRAPLSAREDLDAFWLSFWGSFFGLWPEDTRQEKPRTAWLEFTRRHPRLSRAMRRHLCEFHHNMRQAQDGDFWRQGPALLRPLYSQAHILLQNDDFSRTRQKEILDMTGELQDITAEGRS